MATHSSILAWDTPWTEEHVGLQSWDWKVSDMTEQLNTQLMKMQLSSGNYVAIFFLLEWS